MTPDEIDAVVAKLPANMDPDVRAGVMTWVGYLKDPEIGEEVAKMLHLAIKAGSWEQFLATLE
jgi:hypothetical protein